MEQTFDDQHDSLTPMEESDLSLLKNSRRIRDPEISGPRDFPMANHDYLWREFLVSMVPHPIQKKILPTTRGILMACPKINFLSLIQML
jgi:hypothetical protein